MNNTIQKVYDLKANKDDIEDECDVGAVAADDGTMRDDAPAVGEGTAAATL